MNIRVDQDGLDPTPPLDPSELDRGLMNMRVLGALVMFVMFLVFVAAAISAVLWLVLR